MGHLKRLLATLLSVSALSLATPTSAQVNTRVQDANPPTQEAWERTVDEVLVRVLTYYHRELTVEFLTDLRTRCIVISIQYPKMPCLEELDPHTIFVTPKNVAYMDERQSGEFVGVGIEIKKSESPAPTGLLIVKPIPNGPAEASGLRSKDIIIEVDGQSLATVPFDEAVSLVRGQVGTSVRLTVYREGMAGYLSVTIVRAKISRQNVTSELKAEGFGYVKIESFSEEAGVKMHQAILSMTQKNRDPLSGLVLDLRDNSGGLVNAADEILDLFLVQSSYPDQDSRTMVSQEIRGEVLKYLSVGGEHDAISGAPLLVLVNGASASASELVPGVLQTHGRAIVAGIEKTFGKGTVQTILNLPSGGRLLLTTSQYLVGPTSCERPVQEVGITPDIILKRTPEDGDPELGRREESLPHSLDPSTISNANCRYPFLVKEAHKEAAKRMLRVLGLEIKE